MYKCIFLLGNNYTVVLSTAFQELFSNLLLVYKWNEFNWYCWTCMFLCEAIAHFLYKHDINITHFIQYTAGHHFFFFKVIILLIHVHDHPYPNCGQMLIQNVSFVDIKNFSTVQRKAASICHHYNHCSEVLAEMSMSFHAA